MMNLLIGKKLYSKTPSQLVKETTAQLRALKQQIDQTPYLDLLAGPDFDKAIKWLEYLQEIQIVKDKIGKKKTGKK